MSLHQVDRSKCAVDQLYRSYSPPMGSHLALDRSPTMVVKMGREKEERFKMKDLTSSRNGRNCSGSMFHSEFGDSQRDEEEKRPSFLSSRGASVSTLQSFILYIGAMKYCCLCSAMIQTDCALRAYYIPSIAVVNPTEPAHPRFLYEKSLDSTAIELKFS